MENGDNLLALNEHLIDCFYEALDGVSEQDVPQWKNPNVLKNTLLPDLRNLIEQYESDIVMLAKFQVSLSKWLDYYYYGWKPEVESKIEKTIAEIVDISYKIIKPYIRYQTPVIVKCGCEDNACFYSNLGPRYNGPDLDENGKWPTLSKKHAKNFSSKPRAITLPKDTHIYRVIGPTNVPNGSWWLFDYTLPDRPFWRSCFAVTKKMNLDNEYVDYRIPDDDGLKVWVGPTASVQVGSHCILPGGFNQIWISLGDAKNFGQMIRKITAWPLHTQA